MNRQLLEKYFDNQCSPEEVRQVLDWVNSHLSKEDFSLDFQKLWQQPCQLEIDYDWTLAWQILQDKIEVKELISSLPVDKGRQMEIQSRSKFNLAIAATIAFAIISLAAFIYFNTGQKPTQQFTAKNSQVQKLTEKGQKLTIHLEDGSKVMLNAQSNLKYPSQFSDSLRELWLQGEAYFEVVGDPDRPFVVHTGEIKTTVLGTSFNITAYDDLKTFRVALAEGKLIVSKPSTGDNLVIAPGEMAVYEREYATLKNESFSTIDIAWKDGIIYFDNTSLTEIIIQLERWYGVEFIINGNLNKQWEFSGKFKNESLRNILEALQFAYDFQYKLDRKRVYMSF
ncbi:MAG: FecR family protein [Cyclobacteriaceae bacterium]